MAGTRSCNLDKETIRKVKASIASGEKQCNIAKKYNVTEGRVSQIKKESLKNDKDFVKKVKEKKIATDKMILDKINSSKSLEIIDKFMEMMIDSTAVENSVKNGIGDFIRGYGVLMDKAIKLRELTLKENTYGLMKELKETYNPQEDNFLKAMDDAAATIDDNYIGKNINVRKDK